MRVSPKLKWICSVENLFSLSVYVVVGLSFAPMVPWTLNSSKSLYLLSDANILLISSFTVDPASSGGIRERLKCY